MDKIQGKRRSIRLKHYDYSSPGSYFITICTHDNKCRFGEIVQDKMCLNEYGEIIQLQWQELPRRFQQLEIDSFVVMPNHTHAIMTIVGAPLAGDHQKDSANQELMKRATLGSIIGAYKSLCVHHCLQWIKYHSPDEVIGKIWQRNFYEHIVRNQTDYARIAEYIQNNVQKWHLDSLNPDNIRLKNNL